jgi:hypothetical protein
MTTLADLKRQIIHLLGDVEDAGANPVAGKQYSASLLLEGVCAGVDAILPWIPKALEALLTGDGTTQAYALPAGLYRIEAVYDQQANILMPEGMLAAGNAWGSLTEQRWLEYPGGFITFMKPLASPGARLYYTGMWTKPALDADAIEPPAITHIGIVLFAASYCLLSKASASANIRQYNTKVDSGVPIHNPEAEMSTYFLRRFEAEMNRHPARAKGQR